MWGVTVPQVRPRHPLLPDRARSHAVLVASNTGSRQLPSSRRPEEVTARLARVLTSPGPDGAFHARNTTLVLGAERPADVLDALLHAAGAASDVLLFWYAGRGLLHEDTLTFGALGTDAPYPAGAGVELAAVAQIMTTSQAVRPAVLLDCDYAAVATTRFTGTAPAPSLLAADASSFWPMADPFTETLIEGLTGGVQDGPEMLDLVTLRDAVAAAHTRTRYCVENEFIGGPAGVLVRGGAELALGGNPAFGPNGSGALPPHPDAVDARES